MSPHADHNEPRKAPPTPVPLVPTSGDADGPANVSALIENGSPSTQSDEQSDRLAQPTADEQPPRLPFPVIGIGASAGGLEAYAEFLKATRPESGMAFVLIQHLSPKHESLLAELLSQYTTMPVLQVEDGMRVEPNTVYVIRPGYTMTLHFGRLRLGEPASDRGHRKPVDDFFRSLAEEQRERAVCVILSGTGSNGTAGARSVKAVGGLCIAEDPDAAKFPGMPRALIEAGLADFVLRPGEMFEVIDRVLRQPYASGTATPPEVVARHERHVISDVLAVLRTRGRHDFTGYRKQTLVRRIQRRMSLMQLTSMADYARGLRQNPGEVVALADDMLIHVTGFFRDVEVWETLRDQVIAPLVAERPDGASIRGWVTACSSGEEAYTLAMLIADAAGRANKHFDIKVFATDTAERSLGMARRGVFPDGIEGEVPPDLLEKYFVKDDASYHVKKELRELVVFAPQNLLEDPPFSRLDICTCRNLLIYLEPEVQRRVMALLHFSLSEAGVLVLGNSETIGNAEELFQPLDKKRRIFRRIGPRRRGALGTIGKLPDLSAPVPHERPTAPPDHEHSAHRVTVAQLADRALLERYTPAAVVIDRDGHIVYFHGRTERFIDQPRGEPTRELLALVREPLRRAVRSAVESALANGRAVRNDEGAIGEGGERRRVTVSIKPLDHSKSLAYFLATFEEQPEGLAPSAAPIRDDNGNLALELARVRHELHSAIEELQTSNEEMKASNEEVTSVNEELQSTNEELETSKEELQSLNEELTTVNVQLVEKMEELERTGNDLTSLLSSTDIAVIFLDTQLRIRRFTPATTELIDMLPADAGRPLSDLAHKFTDPELPDDARGVLDKLVPREKEVRSDANRWYLRRVMPYRTSTNRIDGVVITFVDITDRRRAEDALRESVLLHRVLTANLPGGAAFIIDADLRLRLAQGQALRQVGVTSDAVEGKSLREVMAQSLADTLEADCRRALAGEPFQSERHGDGRDFITHGVPLRDASGTVYAALVVSYDITDRKRIEAELRHNADRNAFRLQLADALRPLSDPQGLYAEAANVLGRRLGANRVLCGEVADERITVLGESLAGLPAIGTSMQIRDMGAIPLAKLLAGRAVVIADAAATDDLDNAERERYAAVGAAAIVAVPLVIDARLKAVFVVYQDRARAWVPDDVALIEETAERTWAAIERVRAESALRASEARFRALLAGARQLAIIITDPDNRVLLWNVGATSITGFSEQEMLGRSASVIFTSEDLAAGADVNELETARSHGGAADERWHVRKDGSRFWGSGVLSRLPGADGGSPAGFVKVLHDATARRQAEESVRASEERLRLIVDNISEHAIYLLDPRGHVRTWWNGARRLTGYEADEVLGRHFSIFSTPEDIERGVPTTELELAAKDGRAECEGPRVRKDGSTFWVNEVMNGIRDPEGGLIGFVKISRDITAQRATQQAHVELLGRERDARNAAEQANRVKDEFLATLSHELRTPLSAILIWARLLHTRDASPENLAEGLDAIERSAHAQQQLINDLLDSSRIASGKLRLEMRQTDLPRLITKSVDAVLPTAEAKGVQVVSQLGAEVGTVMADPDRLRQVIWNLLINAIKFTPAGGTITMGLARIDGTVVIRCADTGRGISPDFLPHVFERFRQADSTRARAVGGLGLGLAIVKQLVEMHGGTITAESPGEGSGATFTVCLPLREVTSTRAVSTLKRIGRDPRVKRATLRGRSVLLVEDQADARAALTSLLRSEGALVTAVENASAGRNAFGTARPHLLLSDIGLPDQDGYAMLRDIRVQEAAEGTARVPAIALTAFARDEDRRLAAEAGYDRFITKPFEPAALISAARSLLRPMTPD